MSKRCAKCEKTVYPTEELKCLDKVWHKSCFKCQECNMTLNMKNYKGYNKLPYCNAHYPTTRHTVVADTPESRRIAENTKIQSNVQYHSDFERQKGTYTQVTDTPDMIRHQQNTKNISLIEYHKDFTESKGSCCQIPDSVEMRTHRRNTENISMIEYHKDFTESKGSCYQVPDTVEMRTHRRNTENISMIKYHEDFEKMKGKKLTVTDDPELMRIKQNTAIQSNVEYHKVRDQLNQMEQRRPDREQYVEGTSRRVGSIADYDPMNENFGSITGQYKEPQRVSAPPMQAQPPHPVQHQPPPPQTMQPQDRFAGKGMVCQAMYDYTAADVDEISFNDGDYIIHCEPIDPGWMEGTVDRTGQRGMLPSNYVERVN